MRNAFVETITHLAEKDPSIMLVIGDTGFGAFEGFEAKFSGRFVNVGIAEQQFVSFAAGLAMSGMKVFAYNICTFLIRAMEQIRIEMSYQLAPVVLVGVGGGFWYGTQGPTHHAVEDISQLRALPNLNIICPGDPQQMKLATEKAIYSGKPTYIRICRNNDYILPVQLPNFTIGKAIKMREGGDIALIATGGMLKEALSVANILQEQGLSICVLNMHTIKPIDKTAILDCAKHCRAVFTLEENTILGGLGGAVAETLLQNNAIPMHFDMFGIPDTHARVSGTRDFLNEYYRLDVKSMVTRITERLKS